MPTVEICDANHGCQPWPIDTGCCSTWGDYDAALQGRATALAWRTLRTLTGGRVGSCPVTMRPCLSPPCNWCTRNWLNPIIRNGDWLNAVCGCHDCSCTPLCEIDLLTLVASITSITVGVETFPLDDVRIDNGHLLVREDGQCWPSCQELGRPLGQPGTMGITYLPGIEPDSAGLWAAGVLACEYAKACSGGNCRLPTGITAIARQGVSMDMSPTLFPNGLTGIREVDAYIFSVNPHHHTTPPRVYSPDLPKHRVTTWHS